MIVYDPRQAEVSRLQIDLRATKKKMNDIRVAAYERSGAAHDASVLHAELHRRNAYIPEDCR